MNMLIEKLGLFLGAVVIVLYISLYCTLIYWIGYNIL